MRLFNVGGIAGNIGTSNRIIGTNYYTGPPADAVGDGTACVAPTCNQITLPDLQAISTLPTDWDAEDWDLRGPNQVPALKYGGGPDICGELCGQVIPNQPD